jgi:hypothetical protein
MLLQVTITDLTRMSGSRVCLAGYTLDQICVRPVLRFGGLEESWLYQNGRIMIRPFAVIRFNANTEESIQNPPHCEDRIISLLYHKVGQLDERQKQELLGEIVDEGVTQIFGAEIQSDMGYYIRAGEGTRSLGTVCAEITQVSYGPTEDGKWDYRIQFTDQMGDAYRLKVTDLALRMFFDYQRDHNNLSLAAIASGFRSAINQAKVYLRIGLARPWKPVHPDKCFLQVTGIYTFPDYLQGKCFADFIEHEDSAVN